MDGEAWPSRGRWQIFSATRRRRQAVGVARGTCSAGDVLLRKEHPAPPTPPSSLSFSSPRRAVSAAPPPSRCNLHFDSLSFSLPYTFLAVSLHLSLTFSTEKRFFEEKMHNPTPAPGDKNLQCPRCESTNTKFCYYNNYNLSQPRHFCRSCRRYWTRGGSLRNIPVGGGSRRHPKHNAANASMRGKRSAPDPRPPPPETHIQTTEPGFSPGSSATDIDRMLLNATGSFTALLCMEIFPPFDLLAVTNGGAAPLPEEERISFAL